MHRALMLIAAGAAVIASACNEAQPTSTSSPPPPAAQGAATTTVAPPASPVAPAVDQRPKLEFPAPTTLLAAQARFSFVPGEDGKDKPQPLPATLVLLTPKDKGDAFEVERLEDPDSRVFHKAACVDFGDGPRILTIGASEAIAKLWRREGGAWQAQTLWRAAFGGAWDRLRDFELGDVDGDGRADLVIATHDQGVMAVLSRRPTAAGSAAAAPASVAADSATIEVARGWTATEVHRSPDTFIHEVEIGDVDGDGKNELFATPSTPNKVDAAQSGDILAFRYLPSKGYVEEQVAHFNAAHVKEILVTDLDGNGSAELYANVELARTKAGGAPPVEVRQYWKDPKKRGWQSRVIATVPGAVQARVLLAADLVGRGRPELIITTMKAGLWRIAPEGAAGALAARAPWTLTPIDGDSGGFEHAAGVADLDGNGRPELYVSADEQNEIRQYRWDGNGFTRATIYGMDAADLTWNLLPCVVQKVP